MAYESLPKIAPALFSSEQDLIEVYNKKTDTVGVINPSQISTPLPSGVLSVDNPLSSTLQPIEDKSGTASALSISTNRVGLASDPSVTTQSSSVIAASTTNANLVIAPNGTGALVASIPDGTATGGNARGAYAVDLQISRANANQVAGGSQTFLGGGQENFISTTVSRSAIVNGYQNITNSGFTFIGSGAYNTVGLNSVSGYSAIVSGSSNKINYGTNSFIGSGDGNIISAAGGGGIVICGGSTNTASSSYSVVSGGQSNTASTGTHATVGGGQSNTSSGIWSVIAGGFSNIASNQRSLVAGGGSNNSTNLSSTVSGGSSNTASGSQSTVIGGQSNSSSGQGSISGGLSNSTQGIASTAFGESNIIVSNYSTGIGFRTTGYLYGQFQNGSGFFVNGGDAQQSSLTARREATLTTGATTVLSLDGTGTTNLIIPFGQNRMWNVQVRWVAVVTAITGTATGVTVGDTKTSTDLLAVAKRSFVTTVSAHTSAGTHAIETSAGSLTAANIAYTAGASQEMAITFTGPTFAGGGSVTMRVVAAISLTEVAY